MEASKASVNPSEVHVLLSEVGDAKLTEELCRMNLDETTENDFMSKERRVLSNYVILHCLFGFLSLKEVKTCRQVCRAWRDASWSTLKLRCQFKIRSTIRFNWLDSFVQVFKDKLSEDLFPFNSIKLYFIYDYDEDSVKYYNFIQLYGHLITVLSTEVKCSYYSEPNIFDTSDFIKWRNVILEHMPNIKVLRMDIQVLNGLRYRHKIIINNATINPNLKHLCLNSLTLSVGFLAETKKFTNEVFSILSTFLVLERLSSLVLNIKWSDFYSILEFLPYDWISALTTIVFEKHHYMRDNLLSVLNILIALSKKGMKLHTFVLKAKPGMGKTDLIYCERYYDRLMQFLATQNCYLKHLTVGLEYYGYIYGTFKFPRMEKLTKLFLKVEEFEFQDETNWNLKFPELKHLTIKYTFFHSFANNYKADSFPDMIQKLKSKNNSLLSCTLIYNHELETIINKFPEMDDCIRFYNLTKEKFLNLRHFYIEFRCPGIKSKFISYFQYSGNNQDTVDRNYHRELVGIGYKSTD